MQSASRNPKRMPLFEQSRPIRLEYLGWSRPILHSACDYLFEHHSRGREWNLDRMLLVLPGSLAGRRLQMLLAQRAAREDVVLRPPEILTLGKLPERLYQAKLPFASELDQVMAWTAVLRNMPFEELKPLLFEVPQTDELTPWMELGRILGSLHRELASDLLDFSDVAETLTGTAEESRWHVLATLQRRYLDLLDEAGLWDIQTARRFALQHGEVKPSEHDIILIGTVDLNRAQRQFLAVVGPQVTSLVGAPKSFSAGFDDDGTLRSEFWQQLEIPIDEEALHVRSTVRDAADELAVQLALLGTTRSPSEITVGVPDPTLIPAFQESLHRTGVALRYGPGVAIQSTQPTKLLGIIQEFLAKGETEAFHTLIRETTVDGWLRRQCELPDDYLASIDDYLNATLLQSVRALVLPEARRGKPEFECVLTAIDSLLEPLRSGKRPLSQWVDPIRAVLKTLYAGFEIDQRTEEGNALWRSCGEINNALEQWTFTPANLNADIELQDSLMWLQQMLHGLQIPPLRDPHSIEMIGWLELALDDAPVLMLSGMHDGVIPESLNSDAFLPNQLRSRLGLIDNARRYARDAYVMMTILKTREQVEFILNRLNSDGDPQTPSRLLLSVPMERLARRVLRLISDTEPVRAKVATWTPRIGQSDIAIPKPKDGGAVTDMAVTDFKKYSECPYRFYLNRVLKLRSVEHLPLELDGGAFGDLVHQVLEDFFDSPVAGAKESEPIEKWLVSHLKEESERRFGISPPPAVVVQIEQAQTRLKSFAPLHAQRVREGWVMQEAEFKVERQGAVQLELDDEKIMKLHGRIDRIDRHEADDLWAVWDYKTGDRAGKPRDVHLKSGKWVDWQLPLYAELIRAKMGVDLAKATFGYILIPKNVGETAFLPADFKTEELESAVESAKELASRVINGVFWPPEEGIAVDYDDFEAITQRSVVRRWDPNGASKIGEAPHCEEPPNRPPRLRSPIDAPSFLEIKPVAIEGEIPHAWFQPQMIRASAGTGKTYRLASRAIQLLFADQPLETVLATTFTRKAAGEILHRILTLLAKACETEGDLTKLRKILEPVHVSREAVRYQLARLCAQLHRFRVSTLDSFYAQLARSFSLELQLPPGWTMIDPSQEEQLRRDAVTRMFENIGQVQLRSMISQLAKGDAIRSIRNQIDDVVESGYLLYQQAPKLEVWETLKISPGPSDEALQKAIQVLQETSLGSEDRDARRDSVLQKFFNQDWEEFLKETLVINCHSDKPTYSRKEIEAPVAQAMRVLAKHASVAFLASRNSQNRAAFELLEQFDKQLCYLKQQRRIFTFTDIANRIAAWLTRTLTDQSDAVSGKRSLESISHRLDCSIDHLLLDEFQDTSPQQWEILRPFALSIQATLADQPQAASFFVVGDAKQAIYAWRGGVSEVFESVGREISKIHLENLASSRRSAPIIIAFVNDVFQRLSQHPKYLGDDTSSKSTGPHPVIAAWIKKYFEDHTTFQEELPGYIQIRNAPVIAEGEDSSSVGDLMFETIAEQIATLHEQAPKATIGVLTRTNLEVAEMISLLRERGIEASQEGGNELIDTAAVLVLRSALHLAVHPGDTVAHFHVTESPLASYWPESVRVSPNILARELRREIDLRGLGATVSNLVNHIASSCNARDQERLRQLVEEAFRFMNFRSNHLHAFIEFLNANRVSLPSESRVRVMTIHQAKGLEFDAVFLPSLEKKIVSRPPSYLVMRESSVSPPIGIMRYVTRELHNYLDPLWQIAFKEAAEQQLGDALCLFYVALTRARHALYLVTVPQKNPTKTWASVLHTLYGSSASSSRPGTMLYESGKPDWYAYLQTAAPPSDAEADTEAENRADSLKHYRIALASRMEEVVDGTVAPSALKATQETEPSLSSVWQSETNQGAVVGKLVHRWMEEIRDWVEDGIPGRKRLSELANSSMTLDELAQIRVSEWIERFGKYLEAPEVRAALSRGRYETWHRPKLLRLEVSRERRLLEQFDRQLVRGSIDRCVLGYDGDRVVRGEVLDFKVDQGTDFEGLEAWIADRIREHSPQLQLYGRVLRQQYGLRADQLDLTLVLLSVGRVVSIPVVATEPLSDASSRTQVL
jgi:ATP-dependent exoDNAse (exonuclease V) beta subunit